MFGKVSKEELQMKECSFEKGAGAMKLLHYEEVEFIVYQNGEFRLEVQTICRIKIFNQNGYSSASVVIPYTGRTGTSKITDIEANTYNLDVQGGIKITPVDKQQIFRSKAAEKGDLSTVRFTFPEVKPGSVIEYRYSRTEKDSYFIPPWSFQGDIPTKLSSCKIIMPAFSYLDQKVVASQPVTQDTNYIISSRWGKSRIKTYTMRDVPSFKGEPFMSAETDNLQEVEFSLVPQGSVLDFHLNTNGKWNFFNTFFLKAYFFGQQFNTPISGTDNFIDSMIALDGTPAKVNAALHYVRREVKWNRRYSFFAHDITEVWKNKKGNSAEINIILLNLLRRTGMTCYPVLVSTRDNGMIDEDFASVMQFNNVDVMVPLDKGYLLLDGTEKFLSYDTPPLNVLNRKVFIIDPYKSKWLYVTDARSLLKDSVSVAANLLEDGTLQGEATITYYNLSKAEKLKKDAKAGDEDDDDDQDSQNYLMTDAQQIKVDTSYTLDGDDAALPLRQVIKFHTQLATTDDFYFLNPFLLSAFRKNPFTDSLRKTDIDFGANASSISHIEITLPGNIRVEELNSNTTIASPDSTLFFSRFNAVNESKFVFNSSFNISQAYFDKGGYPDIADFFNHVYGLLNQEIVLKKQP